MKTAKLLSCLVFVTVILLQTLSLAQAPDQKNVILNEKLKFLEPMLNKKWVGNIKAPDGSKEFEVIRQFDIVWGGNVIKIDGYCRELNNERGGYIYWDSDQNKVGSFLINSRGIITKGFVAEDSGKIVLTGQIIFPEQTLEYKNVFEFTDDGKLLDRWYTIENGAWKPGHDVVLIAEEE